MSSAFRTVNIHLHYGGNFVEKSEIKYTLDKVKVFSNCDPDEISVYSLLNLYCTIEKVPCAKFWYSIPHYGVDVGVVPINDDVDIELLTICYEGLPYMHIYVEAGEKPLKVISPDGKVLFERDDRDDPACSHTRSDQIGNEAPEILYLTANDPEADGTRGRGVDLDS